MYLAEQTSLKRQVALKILRREMLADANYLKRFEQEALAAAGLNHPNIVQVYLIGEDQGIRFIAQEYVQGWNLREYVQRKGPPDLGLVLLIMRQVAAALQVASEAGIVHRDIKPENIMLTRRGEVKVADFGLAQLTLSGERLSLTQSGTTMGTPLYMSPEQVSGSKVDHRSDLYSFGVTCYHLITGEPPFKGETALSVAVQHLREEPKPISAARDDLPASLCRLVHQLLAKDPLQRPQDAQAVLKELKRIGQERTAVQNPAAAALSKSVTEKSIEMPHLSMSLPTVPPRPAVGKISHTMRTVLAHTDQNWGAQLMPLCMAMLLAASSAAVVGWFTRPMNPLRLPAVTSPATANPPAEAGAAPAAPGKTVAPPAAAPAI